MFSVRKLRYSGFTAGAATLALVATGCANDPVSDYPERQIQMTIGWSAGGTSDLAGRLLAQGLEEHLDVPVQITNVEGATGGVGGSQVANQTPDGYSIFAGASTAGMWPVMEQADIGWEAFYSFLAGPSPTAIYVGADSEYETLEDLIAGLEESPGTRYGTPGPGSNGQIFAELLADSAGVEIEHVPYDGGSEAGQYLMAGEIEFASVTLGDMLNLARSEDVRPLTALHDEDLEIAGLEFESVLNSYPDLEGALSVNPWFGVYASRDLEPEVVQALDEALEETVSDEEFQESYENDLGSVPDYTSGEESDEVMARVESGRSWALWDLGVAELDPADLDIPQIEDFSWPPHSRAEEANDWP